MPSMAALAKIAHGLGKRLEIRFISSYQQSTSIKTPVNKNPRFVYKNKAGVLCEGKSDAIGYTGLRGLFLRGNVSFQNFAALHYYVAPHLIC